MKQSSTKSAKPALLSPGSSGSFSVPLRKRVAVTGQSSSPRFRSHSYPTTSTCSAVLSVHGGVMPYGDKITKGQTVELRFEIKPEGTMPTHSTQSATSSMTAKAPSNSLTAPYWSITTECFLKAKPSASTTPPTHPETHKFLVVVEDSFNSTPWQQTFEFNSKDSGDDDSGKTPGIISPVNPGTITPIGL